MHARATLWMISCFVLCAVEARATTMIVADEQKLARAADVILLGRVERTSVRPDPDRAGVRTTVRVAVQEVWKGTVSGKFVEISEYGGDIGTLEERYFGMPVYQGGEQVVSFLTQRRDGTFRTLGMAMGKFSVVTGPAGAVVVRDLGEGSNALEWDGEKLQHVPGRAAFRLEDFERSVRGTLGRRLVPRAAPLEAGEDPTGGVYVAPFGLMGSPARWFEADRGEPVGFWVDANGDFTLGFESSSRAVSNAMQAWTEVPTAKIDLVNLGAAAPQAPDCSGPSQILFNDPTHAIADPFFCSGILALGGYCSSAETTSVNSVEFRRITVGKIVFNDGWGGCPFWNECNLAEIVTHELGHTIGIGHSANARATMFAYAHFDGRCAAVRADDVAAVSFIYPASEAMHDVVVQVPNPVKGVIKAGAAETVLPLKVVVRHADTWDTGAWIGLRAQDGTCPPGTVESVEFGTGERPAQSYVAAGGQVSGILRLRLRSADFTSRDAKAPARCELEIEAGAAADGNIDPYAGNERTKVALDVVDRNDTACKANPAQVSLRPIKPVALRIPLGKTEVERKIAVSVRASAAEQTVSLTVDPGDCPPGLIESLVVPRSTDPFRNVAMRANSTRTARLLLRADRASWTLFPGSPARCTARLAASSDLPDPDLSNNEFPLVIDVQDDNDL